LGSGNRLLAGKLAFAFPGERFVHFPRTGIYRSYGDRHLRIDESRHEEIRRWLFFLQKAEGTGNEVPPTPVREAGTGKEKADGGHRPLQNLVRTGECQSGGAEPLRPEKGG